MFEPIFSWVPCDHLCVLLLTVFWGWSDIKTVYAVYAWLTKSKSFKASWCLGNPLQSLTVTVSFLVSYISKYFLGFGNDSYVTECWNSPSAPPKIFLFYVSCFHSQNRSSSLRGSDNNKKDSDKDLERATERKKKTNWRADRGEVVPVVFCQRSPVDALWETKESDGL